ncbi:MAG: DUF4134 domain-containing protein [Bacteroidota bacterium]
MSTSTLRRIRYTLILLVGAVYNSFAQGVQGIQQADTEIRSYVAPVGDMILGIGAVVGLIGAARVYIAWNNGDQDVTKKIMGWVGACLFLVLVGVVINAFFGT